VSRIKGRPPPPLKKTVLKRSPTVVSPSRSTRITHHKITFHNLRHRFYNIVYCYSCITFFYIFGYLRPDDGCFVQPKHVAAIGFAVIKVACRRTASLLLRLSFSLLCCKRQSWRDILKNILGYLSLPHVYCTEILQKTTLLNSNHLSNTLRMPAL
jgi:hypothetical protein